MKIIKQAGVEKEKWFIKMWDKAMYEEWLAFLEYTKWVKEQFKKKE